MKDVQHRAAEMALLTAAGVPMPSYTTAARFAGNPHQQCLWMRIAGNGINKECRFTQDIPPNPVTRVAEIFCFIANSLAGSCYWTLHIEHGLVKVYGLPATLTWDTFTGVTEDLP